MFPATGETIRAKEAMVFGVERALVLLVVELQQGAGMRRALRQQRAEILQQHHMVGDRRAVVAAQMQGAQRVGGVVGGGAPAGRFPRDGEVIMEHREAVLAMNHKIDLDPGAQRHAFEDALAGEHRIGRAAPGAVPLEESPVTVAGHPDGIRHQAVLER